MRYDVLIIRYCVILYDLGMRSDFIRKLPHYKYCLPVTIRNYVRCVINSLFLQDLAAWYFKVFVQLFC